MKERKVIGKHKDALVDVLQYLRDENLQAQEMDQEDDIDFFTS